MILMMVGLSYSVALTTISYVLTQKTNNPDGHHKYVEPKTFADYVRPEYR